MELLLQVAFLLLFGQQVNALYFLIDGTNEKCFYEDLPKDTIVVGQCYVMVFLFFILYFRSSPSLNKHHFQHSIFYDFN